MKTIPTRPQLWSGAVLATIAHAISMVADPTFSYELSWDGRNYNRQDSEGTRGTITFDSDTLVAVFRDEKSIRILGRSSKRYDLDWFFRDIPDDLMLLARKEALQYVLDDYEGKAIPIITAAFWGRGDNLTASEPWARVVKHGAHLIGKELEELDSAITGWAEYYDLSAAQISLLLSLYARIIEGIGSTIVLTEHEYTVLTSAGDVGISESRDLLLAVGIMLPD